MKLKDIADCIITGVLTRRVVYDGEDNDSSLKEGKILVPKAIDDGLIDHSLLQRVKLDKEVKDKFYTKKGDVIMKLSTPYDSCFIDREEDEGLIVPSFSLIIRGLKSDYDPYFIMAFLSSRYAWNQIERLRSGRTITILSNESVAELDIPEFKKLERERISERYKNYLEFKRMSSEIIELEKERNDVMFFSKEASV
ncbi:MAG: hypothetical protein SPF69_02040 [Candidatus Ornithospirochaeta sp.]|nr:hypothetical protein [Sphaerochaetaceae bacterium]MDY5522851.1 hypothetical protein [Candidatus Ornithospirochaeta sp.]